MVIKERTSMPSVSIVTPTHDTKYLLELWDSIRDQKYTDWEWVIIANNGASVSINDPRVRIIQCPYKMKSVGFLKKYGFMEARGEYIAEVDHDDILTSDCLMEVIEAFNSDPNVGFVYSNDAIYAEEFIPYNEQFGWDHRQFKWNNKTYYEMIIPEAPPTFIWYMPDHIRVWRASVYREIGGHDENYDILDDQDLIIRTYLKTRIKHIDKCLYLYRISGENTWLQHERKIQEKTVEIYNYYAHLIAERYSELNNKMKIDLGGGFGKPEGYISLDLHNGDVKTDLNEHWPLEDNSVGIIRAYDIIEHLKDKQHVMSEAWRVLIDGGWFLIQVPSTDGRGAFQDPTHVSYWNENCFWYWTRKEKAQYIHNDTVKFQEFRLETIFPNEECRKYNIPYTIAYLSAIKSNKKRPHLVQI